MKSILMLNQENNKILNFLNGMTAFCLASILLSACTGAKLDPLEKVLASTVAPRKTVDVNFCTDPAQVVNSKLKYVIILDHSGSNVKNYKIDPTTGMPDLTNGLDYTFAYATDKDKTARYGDRNTEGTLLNFLANTPSNDPNNPLVYFSLFNFSDNPTRYPNDVPFTSDVRAFEALVTEKKREMGDAGATNYLGVLREVQKVIETDINSARTCGLASPSTPSTPTCPNPGLHVSSNYLIVFMSDGAPVIDISPAFYRQPSKDVLSTVAGIMGLQSNSRYVDSINLFTVYYYKPGNNDPFAEKLLKDMAELGNGLPYIVTPDANNPTANTKVDYKRFKTPNRLIKFSLADIFVTNASVVMGTNGEALSDTDLDGLENLKELALGSSPNISDSDSNGVSDFVEFTVNNEKPCSLKNVEGICIRGSATIDYKSGACATVPHTVSQLGAIVFQSSDPSGLNDCEKTVLNNVGGIGNPDSNGDLLPDWLQFKNGIPFQIGTESARESQDVDGMSYYEKIKKSLPVRTPHYLLQNPTSTKYDLELIKTGTIQDCYKLSVEDLPIQGDEDLIQVDIILSSSLLQDRFLYRQGRKRFTKGVHHLSFNDWRDQSEITNTTWRSWP